MHIVKIGDQIWSLENSKIKKYSNGDDIHHIWNKLEYLKNKTL